MFVEKLFPKDDNNNNYYIYVNPIELNMPVVINLTSREYRCEFESMTSSCSFSSLVQPHVTL